MNKEDNNGIRNDYKQVEWAKTSVGPPEEWSPKLNSLILLLNNTEYPMFIIWGADKALLFNQSFSSLFEGDFPILLGQSFKTPVQGLKTDLSSAVDRAFRGRTESIENVFRTSSGKEKHIRFSFSPMSSSDGKIEGIAGSCKQLSTERELSLEKEKELRSALEVAQKTIDTVREPMLVLTRDLRVKSANLSFYRDFQVSGEETIGKLVYELGNGQWNIPALKDLLENVMVDNETFDNFEVTHTFEKLGRRIMLLNARRINHIRLILLAIEDITERKESLEKLKASEEKFRSLFHSIDEGFCIVEMIHNSQGKATDYRFLEVNPAFEKHTGLKDVEGKTIRNVVPSYNAHWFEIFDRVIDTGKPIRLFNKPRPRSDGWNDIFAFRLGGADSNKLVIAYSDITDQKNAEESLRRSREHLQLIMESAKEYAIFTMDLDRNITDWNTGAENLLGYSKEEIIGEKGDKIFVPEERDKEPYEELRLARKYGTAENERWHIRKDGRRFWGSGLTMPLKEKNGNLRGFLKIMKDDTERIKMVKALEESKNRELRLIISENKRKDEFMNIASHELKTPLTSLRAYIQLMLESLKSLDKETLRHFLEKTEISVDRLNQLITDLLEASRINAGKVSNRFDDFEITEMIKDSIEIVQHQTSKHEIVLTGNRKVDVTGDRSRLHQVMDNLLSNAIKFSPNGGTITVSVNEENEAIHVSVADMGIGIPSNQLIEIFKPYSRASMKYKISGLGLGLFICYKIIHDHQGKIWAESKPEQGAVFHFTIPKKK